MRDDDPGPPSQQAYAVTELAAVEPRWMFELLDRRRVSADAARF